MQVVLVMLKDGQRRDFPIVRDMTVVGRREDCDIRIPVGDVSRKHCRFIREGDTIRVEDLGSSNGTYHNGKKVQEAELQAGDKLQIGPAAFVVQIDGVPADEDLQPVGDAPASSGATDDMASSTPETVHEESDFAPVEDASADFSHGVEVAPASVESEGAMDFLSEPSDSQTPIHMDDDEKH